MSEDIEDVFVEAITLIANARLQKRHPDMTIKEWQTREVLEALSLFSEEWARDLPKNT